MTMQLLLYLKAFDWYNFHSLTDHSMKSSTTVSITPEEKFNSQISKMPMIFIHRSTLALPAQSAQAMAILVTIYSVYGWIKCNSAPFLIMVGASVPVCRVSDSVNTVGTSVRSKTQPAELVLASAAYRRSQRPGSYRKEQCVCPHRSHDRSRYTCRC